MAIQKCDKSNGSTLLGDYLVARSVLVQGRNNDAVSLRNDNSISKMCNAVLRVIRHGICSFFSIMAPTFGEDHCKFQFLCNNVCLQVGHAVSTQKICSTLSTSKCELAKKPSEVFKLIDPQSGTVVVEGHVVPKTVWSRAIPNCLQLFVKVLEEFFPNKELLHAVLSTSNTIALGRDARTTVITTPTQEFRLNELVPTFRGNVRKCQQLLNKAVALMRLCQAYLSTGRSPFLLDAHRL